MTKRIWSGIVMALCMALCTGCKPSQMQAAKASEEKEIGLKVQVLNYMDEGLGVVYVNGVWAGSMSSHAGGHSIAGAIGLPAKWHPGLTVEVEWRDNTLWEKTRMVSTRRKCRSSPMTSSMTATYGWHFSRVTRSEPFHRVRRQGFPVFLTA